METTRPKPFCFVIMPLQDAFSEALLSIIKKACTEAGVYCEWIEKQILHQGTLDKIYNQIAKADMIIADLSGKDAHIFYEVGYAHAIGKTTMLLSSDNTDIPIDLKHLPHIIYNDNIKELNKALTEKIKWHVDNPVSKQVGRSTITVYAQQQNILLNDVELKGQINQFGLGRIDIDLTFENNSSTTFLAGDLTVGVIVSDNFSAIDKTDTRFEMIKLPDNRTICMLPWFDTLFPSAFTATKFQLYYNKGVVQEDVTIRIFSSAGAQDHHIKIRFS